MAEIDPQSLVGLLSEAAAEVKCTLVQSRARAGLGSHRDAAGDCQVGWGEPQGRPEQVGTFPCAHLWRRWDEMARKRKTGGGEGQANHGETTLPFALLVMVVQTGGHSPRGPGWRGLALLLDAV